MTIAITCTCKSRLEVDEKFAGQSITCPDCQKPLSVPEPETFTVRTSGFALTSLVLALVGAFTIVGTLAAVVFGVLALWHIRRNPKRITGRPYAVAGIALGAGFTVISIFAYASPQLIGIDSLLRKSQWLGQLQYPPELEVSRPGEGYAITRPSAAWGVLRDDTNYQGSSDFQNLLLVQPAKSMFVMCLVVKVEESEARELKTRCKEIALKKLKNIYLDRGKLQEGLRGVTLEDPMESTQVTDGNRTYQKMIVEKTFQGQKKTYLLRLMVNDASIDLQNRKALYILAGGTDSDKFEESREELEQVLNSFRTIGAPNRGSGKWAPGGG